MQIINVVRLAAGAEPSTKTGVNPIMYFRRLSLAAAIAATLLTGCGSGTSGGPQTTQTPGTSVDSTTTNQNKLMVIKGVAAFGTPMRTAAVTIIGRNSQGAIDTSITGVATGEDGSYSISVPASWKAPFLLEATGNTGDRVVVLHAILGDDFEANASSQIINITTFTEAIFASVTGRKPSDFYLDMKTVDSAAETADDAAQLAALTKPAIDAKHSELRAALAPLLSAVRADRPDNINLISTVFSANHTDLDKALDMTSMFYSSDGSKLELTNKADPTSGITINLASKTISGSMPKAVASTIETINSLANDMNSLYKSGVPSSSSLAPYLPSTYLNDGTDSSSLQAVLASADYAGANFTLNNINAIYLDDSNNYRYDVVIRIRKTNQTTEYQRTTIAKTAQGWQFVGNGRAALTNILSFYSKNYDLSGSPLAAEPTTAGLILRIEQPDPGKWFDKAVISGPGFNNPVTLLRSNQTKNENGLTTGCATLSLAANNCQTRLKFDKESDFNRDFNFVYNVKLYRNAADGTPYQQYNVQLPVKPYLSTDAVPVLVALTDGYYKSYTDSSSGQQTTTTIASPTLSTLRSYTGGDLPVYWQKGLAYDTGYTYFIGLDVDLCLVGQLKTLQKVTYGDYLDSDKNRTVTFSTDIAAEKPDYPQLRTFPSMAGLEPNIVRRDLRVFTQDANDRVYYSSYSNSLAASCQ